MANLVFDTFAGANGTDIADHTPDTDVIGGGWLQSATDEVELDGSGAVRFASNGAYARIDTGTVDQIVTIHYTAGGADNRFGLALRSDNAGVSSATRYLFNFKTGDASSTLQITKYVSGVGTVIADSPFAVNSSSTYEFKCSVRGSELSWVIDGVEEISATDSEITTGQFAGLQHVKWTTSASKVYDFQATDASLESQGFTNLGTLKVPSLGVGITSSNTPLLIKAADLTTAMVNNLKADWGDLRLSTDITGNNQLPLDIPATDIAWTRLTNVAADEVIYIWGNKPAAVKETDTATFGRNAVHQDKVFHLELEETSGNPIDSAGNTSWIYQGSVTQGVDTTIGKGVTLPAASNLYSTDADDLIPIGKNYNLSFVADFTSHANNSQIIASSYSYFQRKDSNDQAKSRYNNGHRTISNGYTTAFSTSAGMAVYHLTNQDGIIRIYRDGVQYFYYSGGSVDQTWSDFISLFEGTTVTVRSLSFSNTPIYIDQAKIEYQNQSATDAWWIAEDAANDLGTQGFTNLGTLKVPSLGGATAANVPLLIKAADLTTNQNNNLKADWGDLRISTDLAGNNQLPLDIAATDLAWTRLTSVAADEVIYVWGNKPAAVKEIDTATYGKHAVYQDHLHVYDFSSDVNSFSDQTGASRSISFVGSSAHPLDSDGYLEVGKWDYLNINGGQIPFSPTDALSLEFEFKARASGDGIIFSAYGYPDYNSIYVKLNTNRTIDIVLGNGSSGSTAGYRQFRYTFAHEIGVPYRINIEIPSTISSSSDVRLWANGVEDTLSSTAGGAAYSSLLDTGANGGEGFLGYRRKSGENPPNTSHKSLSISKVYRGEDYVAIRNQNADAADSWWIAEDAGGATNDAEFASVNTSDSTLDGFVRLLGGFTSTNVSTSTLTASASVLDAAFSSVNTLASSLDGNPRLSGSMASSNNSSSEADGKVRLSGTFTSVNTVQTIVSFGTTIATGGFSSTNISDSTLDGNARLSTGFTSSITSDSNANGFVRLITGFESVATSGSELDGLIRLLGEFESTNNSFSYLNGIVNGIINPSEPPLYINLTSTVIDVNLVRIPYEIELEG